MRLAFVDRSGPRYALEALERAPLGGSQSAMLTVARELARAGWEVFVASTDFAHGARHGGITGLNLKALAGDERGPEVDALVTLNRIVPAAELRALFPGRPRVFHWHQNDALSPYGRNFADPAFYAHVERIVFCSRYQFESFARAHGVPPGRAAIIPSPVAPEFCDLFAPDEPILSAKDPDLMVYASAPNRGLEELARIVLPELRRARPALELEVYSGFYIDQGAGYKRGGVDRTAHYRQLLSELATMPGVRVERGLDKSALAARMRRAAMLCYPCKYRETFCIVAAEAMAAGCLVSATAYAALPETTAGFAWLTPLVSERFMPADFVRSTLAALEARERQPEEIEARLRSQVEHANRRHAPAAVAALWQEFFRRVG